MKNEHWIDEALLNLQAQGLFRRLTARPAAGGKMAGREGPLLNFASNDYLDFLKRPELKLAAAEAARTFGAGSGASRLVTGTLTLHEQVEAAAATSKGYPAALLFGSGYMANVGAVTALVGRDDTVIADRLIHASLIDAIHLSGAALRRFRHNDPDDLRRVLPKTTGRTLVVTESVFSMDGDLAPLPEITALAEEYGAMLLVDEAHATGMFGPCGRGLVVAHGLSGRVNITMSTFSKALGGYGGIVACSERMRAWLINKSRAFIYTTAPPPAQCAAALAALALLEKEPEGGPLLLQRAAYFRALLHARGFDTGSSASQIVPVVLGDNDAVLSVAAQLADEGIIVAAIRPPTVPVGTARLRFSVTLAHGEDDLLRAADALARCYEGGGHAS